MRRFDIHRSNFKSTLNQAMVFALDKERAIVLFVGNSFCASIREEEGKGWY